MEAMGLFCQPNHISSGPWIFEITPNRRICRTAHQKTYEMPQFPWRMTKKQGLMRCRSMTIWLRQITFMNDICLESNFHGPCIIRARQMGPFVLMLIYHLTNILVQTKRTSEKQAPSFFHRNNSRKFFKPKFTTCMIEK